METVALHRYGVFVGIVALWIDALVFTLLGPGSSISFNVPLLTSASIPAAVLGGTICFAAALTENAAIRKKERAAR
jgi:Na+/glutamate symporter